MRSRKASQPASNCRRRVADVRRGGQNLGCHVDFHRLERRLEQRLLARKMMVERAAADLACGQHGFDRNRGVATLGEETRRRVHDDAAGLLTFLQPLVSRPICDGLLQGVSPPLDKPTVGLH